MNRFTTRTILITVVLSAVLAGCFDPSGHVLEIVSISPDIDAESVLVDAVITAELSDEVDPVTVTADTVQLLSGTRAEGTVVASTASVSGTTITITPDSNLVFGKLYTVVLAGTIATEKGVMFSGEASWSFTTRYIEISVVTGTGQPINHVPVTIDGSWAGYTDVTGSRSVSIASGGTVSVIATPKFFVAPDSQALPLDGSVYEVEIVADEPYIFVPNVPAEGTNAIYRLDAIDGAVQSTVTSVDYLPGPESYTLVGPHAVEVDYLNGVIYVADAPAYGTPTAIIRMTEFPPAADGSEAEVVALEGDVSVKGVQQIVVEDDGSLVMLDADLAYPGQYRLVRLPSDLDYASAEFGTWFTGDGIPSLYAYGLSKLPDGSFLITGGSYNYTIAETLDSIDDTAGDGFGSLTVGTGTNNLAFPTRTVVSPYDDYVYFSDTGYQWGAPDNSRIVRTTVDGGGFASYGGSGSGTGQFDNPVILGLLPDNKLYIMDVDNSRLVRIDPGALSGRAAQWEESTIAVEFDYWYNYS